MWFAYRSLYDDGSLVERTDANSTVTCYLHDVWGRLTSEAYTAGPGVAATPAKTFTYDYASVDSQTMSNTAGRLAEAYTGPPNAKITDEGFGYDAMGRPSELYESTPNSGTYYAVTSSWWMNGALASLSAPSIPAITYGPDSAGRVSTVANGANTLATITYNPAWQVQQVTFGSSDYDSYGFDNDGRVNAYTLDINGQNDTGGLTWNANGTLGILNITDPFASGDTQKCTYGQDDMGRLQSVSCGSAWNQSFLADAFGNQGTTASSSDAFNASFSSNRISSFNGFTPRYDNDGELIDNPETKSTNAYAWDGDGHAVTVETASQTFDALGRLVENSQAGEVLWTPWGTRLGTMNGSGAGLGVVALPGGGAAVYSGGAFDYYAHADWQGSWRLASTAGRGFVGEEAYGPYGTSYAGAGPASFTGKLNDTPDKFYDFPARLLSPDMKRWLSPDPAGLGAVNPANPQTWDAYAYVGNNPLAAVDPQGLCGTGQRSCRGGCDGFGFDPCGGGGGSESVLGPGFDGDFFMLLPMSMTPTAILAYMPPAENIDDPNFGLVYLAPIYGNADAWSALGQIIWSPEYSVLATLEGHTAPGSPLRPKTTYGLSTDHSLFVALPDSTLRHDCVRVTVPSTGRTAVVPVGDVGPWNGGGTRSDRFAFNDPYWFTGGPPETTAGVDLRGRTVSRYDVGTGMDISFALQRQLGLRTNTEVTWQFQGCQ